MKITAAIAMGLALAASTQAADKVRVCVNPSPNTLSIVLIRAEAMASQCLRPLQSRSNGTPPNVPSVGTPGRLARVNSGTYVSFSDLAKAETIASRMFATAGVTLEWRDAGSAACRNSDQARTVVLDFHVHTARSDHPGAFAYALPYQGSHIVVLFDRFEESAGGPRQVSTILARDGA